MLRSFKTKLYITTVDATMTFFVDFRSKTCIGKLYFCVRHSWFACIWLAGEGIPLIFWHVWLNMQPPWSSPKIASFLDRTSPNFHPLWMMKKTYVFKFFCMFDGRRHLAHFWRILKVQNGQRLCKASHIQAPKMPEKGKPERGTTEMSQGRSEDMMALESWKCAADGCGLLIRHARIWSSTDAMKVMLLCFLMLL